jgi:DNA (cytosine-5)-methyltransferase 1
MMPRRTFMDKTICELFAGVGGFRLGFDRLQTGWKTTWFSQWEPGKTKQWAHDCYVYHFGDCADLKGEYHTGEDISVMDKNNIPDHNLLVGGFPCQDYSVAHSLSSSKGIEGKKGALWWQIRDILITKRPSFVMLENVDRLLKSPASQRGRDFGIILTSFAQLGYRVEWRVINAAEYGAVQIRRRTFIFAYNKDTKYAKAMDKLEALDIISREGFMVNSFPISEIGTSSSTEVLCTDVTNIDRQILLTEGTEASDNDLLEMTQNFAFGFLSSGYMKDGVVTTAEVTPISIEPQLMADIVQRKADESFFINQDDMPSWTYMKGAKKIPRKSQSGHEYIFSEGPIAFPDPLDRPARTMLTSEGTKNRSTHVIADPGNGRLRILTPVETERIQGFDDEWTKISLMDGKETEMPARMRRFCMGNALVVPMITRMGKVLDKIIDNE